MMHLPTGNATAAWSCVCPHLPLHHHLCLCRAFCQPLQRLASRHGRHQQQPVRHSVLHQQQQQQQQQSSEGDVLLRNVSELWSR
jgi:hypothetical protein